MNWKEDAEDLLTCLLDKVNDIDDDIAILTKALDNDQEDIFVILDKKWSDW